MFSLFDFIADALHTVAKILMYVEVLFFLVMGIIVMTSDIISGVILLFVGVSGSISSSLILYSLGELVTNTDLILAKQHMAYKAAKEENEKKNKFD